MIETYDGMLLRGPSIKAELPDTVPLDCRALARRRHRMDYRHTHRVCEVIVVDIKLVVAVHRGSGQ